MQVAEGIMMAFTWIIVFCYVFMYLLQLSDSWLKTTAFGQTWQRPSGVKLPGIARPSVNNNQKTVMQTKTARGCLSQQTHQQARAHGSDTATNGCLLELSGG
jgi:hypothetical protein